MSGNTKQKRKTQARKARQQRACGLAGNSKQVHLTPGRVKISKSIHVRNEKTSKLGYGFGPFFVR